MARFVIQTGPSRFDLMMSLCYGDEVGKIRLPVRFVIDHPATHQVSVLVVIDGLERLDRTGEEWGWKGWIVERRFPSLADSPVTIVREATLGQFNLKYRSGHIEINEV